MSCPFCLTMLRDAAGGAGRGAACDVVDVAEVVRDRLAEAVRPG